MWARRRGEAETALTRNEMSGHLPDNLSNDPLHRTDTWLEEAIANEGSPTILRPAHRGGLRLWHSSAEHRVDCQDRIHDRGGWSRDRVRAPEHRFKVTPWRGVRSRP